MVKRGTLCVAAGGSKERPPRVQPFREPSPNDYAAYARLGGPDYKPPRLPASDPCVTDQRTSLATARLYRDPTTVDACDAACAVLMGLQARLRLEALQKFGFPPHKFMFKTPAPPRFVDQLCGGRGAAELTALAAAAPRPCCCDTAQIDMMLRGDTRAVRPPRE